jgi:hypothetical protein
MVVKKMKKAVQLVTKKKESLRVEKSYGMTGSCFAGRPLAGENKITKQKGPRYYGNTNESIHL